MGTIAQFLSDAMDVGSNVFSQGVDSEGYPTINDWVWGDDMYLLIRISPDEALIINRTITLADINARLISSRCDYRMSLKVDDDPIKLARGVELAKIWVKS